MVNGGVCIGYRHICRLQWWIYSWGPISARPPLPPITQKVGQRSGVILTHLVIHSSSERSKHLSAGVAASGWATHSDPSWFTKIVFSETALQSLFGFSSALFLSVCSWICMMRSCILFSSALGQSTEYTENILRNYFLKFKALSALFDQTVKSLLHGLSCIISCL